MRFVGCTRPQGQLESAPDAGSWPEEPLSSASLAAPVSWAAFWDEHGHYCVRASWGAGGGAGNGEAWFAMVDDALDADGTPLPRAVRTPALPFPIQEERSPRLLLVGARSGPNERVVLLARSRRLTSPSDRKAR